MRRGLLIGAVFLVVAATFAVIARPFLETAKPPIVVGLLHSRSSEMQISEEPMIQAEVLALEEIKERGGLLGRPVTWVIANGESDWPTFAKEAERLIITDKVDVIVGCWTSASRKSVKPVVERNDHLLMYPMAYEGVGLSPNIIYTGGSANQQVLPALRWSFDTLKARKYLLVGSDYIWPHTVNAIVKDALKGMGAELVGEEYITFGSADVNEVVAKIQKTSPDVVLSTIAGETNIAFYSRLRQAGIDPGQTPVISFSIAEGEVSKMAHRDVAGHYSAWNYFQSVDRAENHEFVRKFQARYGKDAVTSDVMVAAYNSIRFWAQAVEEAGTADVRTVVKFLRRQSLDAPEGVISIDPDTQHTWRPFYLGKAGSDGTFDIVWSLLKPIRPVPYPITRSPAEWDTFVDELHARWGGSWANPRANQKSSEG